MQHVIDDYARSLQRWLELRFAVTVPIMKRATGSTETAIVVGGYVAGDIYQGGTSDDSLALVHFTRPDNQQVLQVDLGFAIHEESGIVDRWTSAVSGALESERESLLEVLRPTLRLRHMFSDHMTPGVTFNGAPIRV